MKETECVLSENRKLLIKVAELQNELDMKTSMLNYHQRMTYELFQTVDNSTVKGA